MAIYDPADTASGKSLLNVALIIVIVFAGAIYCSMGNEPDIEGDVDNMPPSTVTDFHPINITTTTATLGWTAPGDDGDSGIAAAYDFRGAVDSITENNFTQQFQIVSLASPIPGGLQQVCTVEDLDAGMTYFFAFKARDDAGNWSGLSNCVRVDCPENPVVVFPDPALDSVIRHHVGMLSGDLHVSDLDTIREFNANSAGVQDLTGIQYLTALTMLHLADNPFSDLSPLQTLTSLGGLHIGMTNVTDLTPISGLAGLVQFTAGQTSISNIQALASLTNLLIIRLNDCEVTDFSPLYALPKLEELDISSNAVDDIDFVANFTTPRLLNLSGMQISSLAPLTDLTNLEELFLTFNEVTDLSGLTALTNLSVLDLRFNLIEDVSPLISNYGLASGDELFLQNNPLSEESIGTFIPFLEWRGVTVHF